MAVAPFQVQSGRNNAGWRDESHRFTGTGPGLGRAEEGLRWHRPPASPGGKAVQVQPPAPYPTQAGSEWGGAAIHSPGW